MSKKNNNTNDLFPPNPQMPYIDKNLITASNSSFSFLSKTHQKILKSPIKKTSKLPPLNESHQSKYNDDTILIKPSGSSFKDLHYSEKALRYENIIESFLLNTMAAPLSTALEESLLVTLNASSVTFWQDIPSLHMLYSSRLSKHVTHSSGLVGYTFFSRQILKIEKAASHISYLEKFDKDSCPPTHPVILFPLWDYDNNVCAVVEVTRTPKDSFFSEDDEDFILHFTKKFKIYSNWLFQPKVPHDLVRELMQVMELEQYLLLFQRKIPLLFKCKSAEIWCHDFQKLKLIRYNINETFIDPSSSGIVGDSLTQGCLLNVSINKLMSSYDKNVDGIDDESVLVSPISDIRGDKKWAVCLRKSEKIPIFSTEDENLLRVITPYLITALDNAIRFSEAGEGKLKGSLDHQCVTFLQDASTSISKGEEVLNILKNSFNAIQTLCNADRAYFFQFMPLSQQFETVFCSIPKEQIISHKDKGLVSKTFFNQEFYNIPVAEDDPNFDISADLSTGYKTKSIISIPIINNRKESVGVAQFLNRKDRKPFSNIDLGYIILFGQFCGLLIENSNLYNKNSLFQKQLENYILCSLEISKKKDPKEILETIIQNVKNSCECDRCSIFIYDDVRNVLTTFITDANNLPLTLPVSVGVAATVFTNKTSLFVNDPYHDPRFNKHVDKSTGYITNNVLASPIINNEGIAIGVIEIINQKHGNFSSDHVKILESFSSIISIVFEVNRLQEIMYKGTVRVEMSKWIGEFERDSFEIPTKLKIPENKSSELYKLNFFADDWNGIGLFKIVFHIFNSFKILERFNISNELFFTFLYKVRESYNEPPYHNWIHAIDVLQYVTYQVHLTNSFNILTPFELFAVCVAAISHDVNHGGLNNAYQKITESPLGQLYHDRSVMETHHCSILISIISKPDSNIFHSLNHEEKKTIWKWIIHLILATDMALHFKLIDQANRVLEQNLLDLKEETHRLMSMELIMKVSDISNVSRPFKSADMWVDVLQEEFYRQGDKERELGISYTQPLNNREGQNKAKGQVGFYKAVCLPLYQTISRIFPELVVNLNSVKSNLSRWEEILQEQEATRI